MGCNTSGKGLVAVWPLFGLLILPNNKMNNKVLQLVQIYCENVILCDSSLDLL